MGECGPIFTFQELNELSNEYVTLWIMIVILEAHQDSGSVRYLEGDAMRAFDQYSLKRYGVTLDELRKLSTLPRVSGCR